MHPKLLVYSPPGHGKTHLLGSAVSVTTVNGQKIKSGDPRITPMLILDLEAGKMSIQSKTSEIAWEDLLAKGFEPSVLDILRVRSWDDFSTIYNWLIDNPSVYKTVALDSLSETNYMNLQAAIEFEKSANPKHDDDIPEQRDYLRSATQMRRLVRAFRDLPMAIVFTSHVKEERDPRSAVMQLRPNLVGKLPNELPGMVDILGYLAIEEVVNERGGKTLNRILVVQPSPALMAKDRSENGKLGAEVLNPTLPKLFDLLES